MVVVGEQGLLTNYGIIIPGLYLYLVSQGRAYDAYDAQTDRR